MTDKITFQLMGETGCAGGKCPAIYLGSDGKYYVQGVTVSDDVRAEVALPQEKTLCAFLPSLFRARWSPDRTWKSHTSYLPSYR